MNCYTKYAPTPTTYADGFTFFGQGLDQAFPHLQRLILSFCALTIYGDILFDHCRFRQLHHFELSCFRGPYGDWPQCGGKLCFFNVALLDSLPGFIRRHYVRLTTFLLPPWDLEHMYGISGFANAVTHLANVGNTMGPTVIRTMRSPLIVLSLATRENLSLKDLVHMQLTNVRGALEDFNNLLAGFFLWPRAPYLKVLGLTFKKLEEVPVKDLSSVYPELQELYVDLRYSVSFIVWFTLQMALNLNVIFRRSPILSTTSSFSEGLPT